MSFSVELGNIRRLIKEEPRGGRRRRSLSRAAWALKQAQAGRWRQAQSGLEGSVRLSPREAWPHALRAGIFRAAGEPARAKSALREALRLGPAAWIYAELAKVNEQLGILPEAISNMEEAVALDPCLENRLLKAHLHTCWRDYGLAVEEYSSALAGSGPHAALFFGRSKAYAAQGLMDAAIKDGSEAAALEPRDSALWAWSVQTLIHGKQRKNARARISLVLNSKVSSESFRAAAYFCRGYDGLCAGRFVLAAKDFSRSRQTAKTGALAAKADFYRTLAGLMETARPARRVGLYLIGMGVNPPYSATAEALSALRRCDVVFNNVMDEENFEILRPFCPDCRPLAYHQMGDEARLCAEILSQCGRGKTVGFVTRGNAMLAGPLGAELARRCRVSGLSWRCLPAVSSPEVLSARFGATGVRMEGMAAVASEGLFARAPLSSKASLTLFLDMTSGQSRYSSLCRELKARYGSTRPCLILDHVIGQEPLRRSVGELSRLRDDLSPSAIFYFPHA